MLVDPNIIKVIGMDPSMNNWGISTGTLNLLTGEVLISNLLTVQPIKSTGKQVRQNSKDLEASEQLARAVLDICKGYQAVFVEVPVGSQNARASVGYGICVGVLGALRSTGIPFIEVTATEVKLAAKLNKTATKKEMIQWASSKHPEAPWPRQTIKGVTRIVESTAEHMADSIGAIHAGMASTYFKQLVAMRIQLSN